MHVTLKNLPRLRLADLLRRRKMTLAQFVQESGIHAYGALTQRCDALGVQPPSEEEYTCVVPVKVSSQQDGVVVLEPIPVFDEITGKEIDPDAQVMLPGIEVITDPVAEEPLRFGDKKRRKPKEE